MEIRQKNTKQKESFLMTPKKRSEKENLQQGDIMTVKITALGSKNIGIAELRNGTTLLVPNTKCGEKVQVKIERVFFGRESENKKKVKYAVGTVFQNATPSGSADTISDRSNVNKDFSLKMEKGSPETKTDKSSGKSLQFDVKVGQKFKVTIQKKGPKNSGIVPVSPNFLLLVPNAKVGEKLVVEIQKIKQNYAFATIVPFKKGNSLADHGSNPDVEAHNWAVKKEFDFTSGKKDFVGHEFHIDLPSSAKTFGNFYVVKLRGHIVFVKKGLGVQPGDCIQIQIQKATQNFSIATIQKISPLSLEERKALVRQGVQKMIQSSMHFGEKSIHCNANMRKYLWYRKKGFRFSSSRNLSSGQNTPLSFGMEWTNGLDGAHPSILHSQLTHSNGKERMPHLGHLPNAFQPFAEQNGQLGGRTDDQKPMVKRGRHILNVLKTQRCLNHALKQLAKYAAKGKTFLFIGTKKPAASLIAKTAFLSRTSFFVNTRWLGGMLTNWKTILKSIAQIRPILKQKQKIQKKIFEKRQKIQRRLFQKVFLLRKKSQKFLSKGKYLISQISTSQMSRAEKSQKFMQRKNSLFAANRSLVDAAKKLKAKKIERFQKIQAFEIEAMKISIQKKQLRSFIAKNLRKFAELEKFYELGQEFLKAKNSLLQSGEKNKKLVAVSYEKIEKMKEQGQTNSENWQVPNPSPQIFKKMISILLRFKKGNFVPGLFIPHNIGGEKLSSMNQKANFDRFAGEKGEAFSNRSKSTEALTQTGNTILFSKFLKKFVLFLPFLQNSLKQLSSEILFGREILSNFQKAAENIERMQKTNKEIYQKTVEQASLVCSKLVLQRKNLEAFELSFKQFAAEQRLFKFLPKLRFFPTSQAKMYETIEFFMKKFVDPKLIYPMEQIYDQKLKFTSKKIAITRKQKWQRLEKYFGGITKMAKMSSKQISKNVAIIIGQQEEMSAVRECRKLGMKIFAITDTNCDPQFVDHVIPANDDSRNSIHYVLGEMLRYIRLGQKLRRKISFLRITNAKMQQSMKQKRRF